MEVNEINPVFLMNSEWAGTFLQYTELVAT